jgi:myo-inositol 2-dehydrogenase / D-chiro-inositol 1-dehydrogenase
MTRSSTRRDILKTGAAIGGVALAGNLAVGRFAGGNDTVRVGLIGCGGRGRGAVRDILNAEEKINGANPKVEIVAVADVFKHKAEDAAKAFSNAKSKDYGRYNKQIKITPETIFDGLNAYENLLKADVNLVILATPPGFRPYHLEAAIHAGKNIFCEKPVCAGARKCYGLVEESKKKNIAIVAGTQRRHQKGYLESIKKIEDGAIGDIRAARCSWNGQGIWFHDRAENVSDVAYQLDNWYHFLWVCGDHIVEQHVHNLDVINWVMGGPPVKALGMGGQDVSETVYGAKGTFTTAKGGYKINGEQSGSDDISAYVQEHIDLLNSIRAGRPLNELKNVTDSTFTAILGRNAAYACRELKWDTALASAEDTMPKDLTMTTKLDVPRSPVPGSWKLPPKA